jgi:hypothetical protein
MNPRIGDTSSRELATRLREGAAAVGEPRRTRITNTLPHTLFVSHTSLDDIFIKGSKDGSDFPERGSIWSICGEYFRDPFYHSLRTGGAEGYIEVVGLSLLASTRVLVVWSVNAAQSDYVRAEVLIAKEENKRLAVYAAPNAPPFPFEVPQVSDHGSLCSLLRAWK